MLKYLLSQQCDSRAMRMVKDEKKKKTTRRGKKNSAPIIDNLARTAKKMCRHKQ